MEKLDLTKKYKAYYTAKPKPEIVTIPPTRYLSIEGLGDPSQPLFTEKLQALYPVAYTLKFICKSRGQDFVVPKLEGLWWYDENKYPNVTFTGTPTNVKREDWQYRLLIRIPDFVKESDVVNAIAVVQEKKQVEPAGEIRMHELNEGKVVQMLHVGPFDKEPETLQKIYAFTKEHDLKKNGLHHEIYLSDFRKTPPEKLKTILREPVR